MATNDLQFYQDLAIPPTTPEQFTAGIESRWHQPWSEPVRQKIAGGLAIALIASGLFAPVLEPNTQITQNFESCWHQPWSEPVRVRVFAAAQQQALAQPVALVETITADKWIYPWSEPVRQRPGLSAGLQQAFIAPTLEPNTQITQGYESRWHYPWSEPVRFLRFPAAQQQAFAFQPPSFEIITTDKWIYPWSEPVRQKPGLRANLQQAFIGTVLNPDTQITQNFESRWHYPWSEPVRLKPGLLAALQEFYTKDNIPFHADIFGTLIATEQGDLFFATGLSFTQVNSALVGIVDIVPKSALVGIQLDIPRTSANVGALATNPGAQSGSAVPLVYSANVSIRIV